MNRLKSENKKKLISDELNIIYGFSVGGKGSSLANLNGDRNGRSMCRFCYPFSVLSVYLAGRKVMKVN